MARVPATGEEGQSERVPQHQRPRGALAIDSPAPLSPDLPPPDLVPGPILTSLDLKRHRNPPMKNVGRGPDGKTIPHERTEATAQVVASLIGQGASENYICAALNIRPGVLRTLYKPELEHGEEKANSEVAMAAFDMARSRTSEAMTKFWLERRHPKFKKTEADEGGSIFNIVIHP